MEVRGPSATVSNARAYPREPRTERGRRTQRLLLDAAALGNLIQSADGLRQETRFLSLIAVADVFAAAAAPAAAAAQRLDTALAAARAVDAGAVAKLYTDSQAIAAAVKAARAAAIAKAVATLPD